MLRLNPKGFISGLTLLLILAACMPAIAQPTTGPSVEEMDSLISTTVALTISAHETEQVILNPPTPTLMDTATSAPSPLPTITATAAIIFPTLTPFPSSTPYTSGGGGATFTPPPYACNVVNKSPGDNTVFKPNKDFDIKFSLVNAGTKKWDAGPDLLFDSGTNMLTTNVIYELPDVKPGEKVGPYIFDAKTPKKPGTYTITFKVQGGLCYPYIRIIVKP
jgi:hypothetical protein